MIETEVRVPVETVTPIRPSEAIRLGCLTTTPIEGDLFDWRGGACAIGALMTGFGFGPSDADNDYSIAVEHLRGPALDCPDEGCERPHRFVEDLVDQVVALNDDHRWSRERIADWLAEQGL